MARHQRAQRDAEQHQHRLGQDRRHRKRPARDRRDADRDHGAGDQPARQIAHRNAARRRCRSPASRAAENWARWGERRRQGCGDLAHAALWQIRPPPNKCANAMQQCRLVGSTPLPGRGRGEGSAASLGVSTPSGSLLGKSATACLPRARKLIEHCALLASLRRALAFAPSCTGAEFLALLAVQSLRVGFLGAFQRFRRCAASRLSCAGAAAAGAAAARRRGLRERGAHQEQGRDGARRRGRR